MSFAGSPRVVATDFDGTLVRSDETVSDHSIAVLGRYDDEYVKTAQGWRIKNRVFTAVAGRAPATASK